jgi:hypothetical protein
MTPSVNKLVDDLAAWTDTHEAQIADEQQPETGLGGILAPPEQMAARDEVK